MTDKIGIVLLAAGEGKRLKLSVPKPLAPLNDQKLIDYPIGAAKQFLKENKLDSAFSIVVGHKKEMVMDHLANREMEFPVQEQQLGTADALRSYFAGTKNSHDCQLTLVLCADTPLLTSDVLGELYQKLNNENLDAVAATFKAETPNNYGKIIRAEKGFRIVEEKDATEEQRKINEVNSGLYLFKTSFITEGLKKIDSNNKAGEFYLTDVFQEGANVDALCFEDQNLFLGVNNLQQLEEARSILNRKKVDSLMGEGVVIIDPATVYIQESVQVGKDTIIYPNTFLMGNTEIGSGCTIEPGCIIKDSKVSDRVTLKAYSHLEKTQVGSECAIGPYARLRPGTILGENTKIGNFVETKNSVLDKGVAVSHLSYVGDAEIGEDTNIGCGFITCNYDGEQKHKTTIGKGVFIGSDTQMIAPITIGDQSYVGSGSTINKDVPEKAFAIARGRQENKPNLAQRFLKGKWKIDK